MRQQGYDYSGGSGNGNELATKLERQKPSNHKTKMAGSCLERPNERDTNNGESFIFKERRSLHMRLRELFLFLS
jgi:hypothetical protein